MLSINIPFESMFNWKSDRKLWENPKKDVAKLMAMHDLTTGFDACFGWEWGRGWGF